jgi:hypothetical protein
MDVQKKTRFAQYMDAAKSDSWKRQGHGASKGGEPLTFKTVRSIRSIEPYSIRSISGASPQALYTKPNSGGEVSGQLGESRAMMIDLLQAVITEGTGRAAQKLELLEGGFAQARRQLL